MKQKSFEVTEYEITIEAVGQPALLRGSVKFKNGIPSELMSEAISARDITLVIIFDSKNKVKLTDLHVDILRTHDDSFSFYRPQYKHTFRSEQ